MSVPPKEHDCTRIVELIHGVEVRHFFYVHQINYSKKSNLFAYFEKSFVHLHALRIHISSKSNNYNSFLFC